MIGRARIVAIVERKQIVVLEKGYFVAVMNGFAHSSALSVRCGGVVIVR